MKRFWQVGRLVVFVVVLGLVTTQGCECIPPNLHEDIPILDDTPQEYTETKQDEGEIGTGGGDYKVTYYQAAEPAQKQIKENNLPNVIEEKADGKLLVLDITTWPEGWEVGKIVAVRMGDGKPQYKRLLVRFKLDDDRLAIAVEETSFLEAGLCPNRS